MPVLRGEFHLDDLGRVSDPAALALALLDLVHIVHARRNLAEQGVLAVKPGGGSEADEELAVPAVRVAGAGHAHRTGEELCLVGELGGHVGQVAAAGAGVGGVAGLRHEAGDHAEEFAAVVEAARGQRADLLAGFRREVGAQLDRDDAEGQRHVNGVRRAGGGSGFGHENSGKGGGSGGGEKRAASDDHGLPTRRRVLSNVSFGTKLEMSPPSWAISLTKRDEMNWCRSLAIRKIVSIRWSSRAFIPAIWNS